MAEKILATIAPDSWLEVLGYLNFSSGTPDPRFLGSLNHLIGELESAGTPPGESARELHRRLAKRLSEMASRPGPFADASQARAVLDLVFDRLLPAYRRHHADLLFHVSDGELLRPFFIGRATEAVLAEGAPWDESERIVAGALARLNDYIGHRPVAVLHNEQKIEPYPHERIRPIPWYIAGVGVGTGRYHDVIVRALDLLRATDLSLLEAAWFDPNLLDELAVDPRAYDFNHPVNKRPNYHFGQWDPHHLDQQGRYRRFVVQQVTLDALLERVENWSLLPPDELMLEAAAVLAGTILMASGTSGNSPQAHDSTATLGTLLPQIATYRDGFYQQLFERLRGSHRERIREEAEALHQPFAAARQHLNTQLARRRALQLQHVHLALLFARLGFADAALRQAEVIPAVSARMICQIHCLIAATHRAADRGQPAEGAARLAEVETLLHRGIECGAIVDPWNILGFGGQFSLFPAVENSIPDSRVDDLLELMERLFNTYARVWHQAAASHDAAVLERLPRDFQRLAEWWDQFASGTITGIRWVSGREAFSAAEGVADALSAWHRAGASGGDLNFWRPFAERFDTPQAYVWVIEALLEKCDLSAAMALLMQWLSQAEQVRLEEGPHSFHTLARRWMHAALVDCREAEADAPDPPRLVAKFFDYLEANADVYWEVPELETASPPRRPEQEAELTAGAEADSEDEPDLYSAAYDEMVYRDSTDDDVEGSMLESLSPRTGYEFEAESSQLTARLGFLASAGAAVVRSGAGTDQLSGARFDLARSLERLARARGSEWPPAAELGNRRSPAAASPPDLFAGIATRIRSTEERTRVTARADRRGLRRGRRGAAVSRCRRG